MAELTQVGNAIDSKMAQRSTPTPQDLQRVGTDSNADATPQKNAADIDILAFYLMMAVEMIQATNKRIDAMGGQEEEVTPMATPVQPVV